MLRVLLIAVFALVGTLLSEPQATAQQRLEIESATPAELDPAPPSDAFVILEPPQAESAGLHFDSSELEGAKYDVLWSRNWFLASAGAQALGWIFLGAGISQCEWVDDVEVCPRAADNLGVAGAAIVVLSGISLLATSIMYGIRSSQRKKLELETRELLSGYGRHPPPASFDEYRRSDGLDGVRRARNGLIASAAMFGVGWIFIGAAIPRCQSAPNYLLECTGPGYAHLVIGLTITGSGAIGTLVSGIVLGARKRNQRLLNRSIQRPPAQGFQWDPRLGAFVF
jgi:hypothetical protein